MSFTRNLHDYFRYPKKVREAAKQMWDLVVKGAVFEIPLSLDRNDPAMNAAFLLQRSHPEVKLGVRQSRSLIISHEKNHAISQQAKLMLLEGGQMYDPEKFTGTIEAMLGGHAEFLASQGLDATEEEKVAKEAEQAKHAIVVGGQGSEVAPAAEPAAAMTPTSEPTP